MFSKHIHPLHFILIAVILGLGGCKAVETAAPSPAVSSPAETSSAPSLAAATLTPTIAPTFTPTPEPLALRVNQEGVTIAEYQAELALLQQAHQELGKTAAPEEQRQQVIDSLVDGLLLAQGAADSGYTVDDAALQAAIDRMGAPAVEAWRTARGYDEASFRAALRRQIAAAWQRDQIAAAVPTEAEQVHVRQILIIDENVASRAYEYVKIPGTNFAAYAYQYDLQAGGDLGWFPRGYLTQPAVEEAAFALQPGEISPVIKSEVGFHIVQLIAREPARLISPDARRVLQHKALDAWLEARRSASQIEILLTE